MVISRKDIIPGTKVQYKKRHLMTSAFLTLTIDQGHITRSKVTDVDVSAFSECFLLFIFLINDALSFCCLLKYILSGSVPFPQSMTQNQ